MKGIRAIHLSYYSSLILMHDGDLFAIGSSDDGSLGIPDIHTHQKRPVKVLNDKSIKFLAVGGQVIKKFFFFHYF